jgi:hypothetical protein
MSQFFYFYTHDFSIQYGPKNIDSFERTLYTLRGVLAHTRKNRLLLTRNVPGQANKWGDQMTETCEDNSFNWVAVYTTTQGEQRRAPFKGLHSREDAEQQAREIVAALEGENEFVALSTPPISY